MAETTLPAAVRADLDFAIDAARAAGRRVLALRAAKRWEGPTLADIGDQAADGFLQGLLRGRYPDDGVLSEETKDSPRRLEKERTWIVDPLDGTREFAQLRDDWAVHVALTVGGACALAVVGLPSVGKLIWGVALPGLERAGLEGEGGAPGDALARGDEPGASPEEPRIACSRSHTPPWTDDFRSALGGRLVKAGSAGYKVGLLLTGEADVYVHQKGLKEWDTCAPETVARALGWTVCKLGGEEHRYNLRDPRNHELVVCRPAWRERVLAAIASSGALAER